MVDESDDGGAAHRRTDGRRSFLRKAGIAAGAAWVAPVIASTSASAQASGVLTLEVPYPTENSLPVCGSGQIGFLLLVANDIQIISAIGASILGVTLSDATATTISVLPDDSWFVGPIVVTGPSPTIIVEYVCL